MRFPHTRRAIREIPQTFWASCKDPNEWYSITQSTVTAAIVWHYASLDLALLATVIGTFAAVPIKAIVLTCKYPRGME